MHRQVQSCQKKSKSSPALQFIFVFVHATGWLVTSTEHFNRDTFSFYILQQCSPMTSLFANMACTTLAWSFWALSMADLDHGELKYNVSTIQNKSISIDTILCKNMTCAKKKAQHLRKTSDWQNTPVTWAHKFWKNNAPFRKQHMTWLDQKNVDSRKSNQMFCVG